MIAGITSTMEPVLAGILGYLILREVLTDMQLLGCLLVIAAVVTAQFKNKPAVQETATNDP